LTAIVSHQGIGWTLTDWMIFMRYHKS